MDFDGVIVDTEVIWYEIFQEWFEKELSYHVSVEEFLTCVGANDQAFFQKLASEKNITVNQEAFSKETSEHFIERSKDLPPKEGVVSFIEAVKQAGLKLALATSSKRAKPVAHLTRLGLIDYFDVIVTAEDVEQIKPAPDLFLEAARQLLVKPHEAVIIEDSKNGLVAGNKAGIPVIVVPNEVTKYSDLTPNYQIVDSLAELNVGQLKKEVDEIVNG